MAKRLFPTLAVVSLLVTGLFLCSCCDISCWSSMGGKQRIRGSGHIRGEDRRLSNFNRIELQGCAKVYVTIEDREHLHIETDENILPYLTTTVQKNALIIRQEENLRPSKGIKVYVSMKAFEGARIEGSGDIIGKTPVEGKGMRFAVTGSGDIAFSVNAHSVYATVSGSGDISLSGTAKKSYLFVSGSGDIKALDLNSNECMAEIAGSGDIKARAGEVMEAVVTGSGDIRYAGGTENITCSIQGSGSIRRIDQ